LEADFVLIVIDIALECPDSDNRYMPMERAESGLGTDFFKGNTEAHTRSTSNKTEDYYSASTYFEVMHLYSSRLNSISETGSKTFLGVERVVVGD
jgi:hypothetical protein